MLLAENISKTYKGQPVLQGAGFSLQNGECLGVAGHNGSGKSTLLSIVAQVVPPTAGSLQCDGKNVLGNRAFLRESLGYVPQQNSLLPDLTVGETLRFWQKTYGLAGSLFAPGTPASLLGLEPLQKKRVGALSGGMQKRLSIALALLHSPRYLLLDEVLSSLDRGYRAVLFHYLAACRQQGGAVLYCSHEISELLEICDNILVLQNGRPAFYGPVASFPQGGPQLDALLDPATAAQGV